MSLSRLLFKYSCAFLLGLFSISYITPAMAQEIVPTPTESCSVSSNVAANGVASQNSTLNPAYPAEHAINGDFSDFTSTHYYNETDNSWTLSFDQDYLIDEVVLYNRENCCQGRLRDITVLIENQGGDIVYESELLNPENELSGPELLTIDIPSTVLASKITVIRTQDMDLSGGGTNLADIRSLSLGEVVVQGCISSSTTIISSLTAPIVIEPLDNIEILRGETLLLPVVLQSSHEDVVYSAARLPEGLSINTETGLISGTPVQTGDHLVTVTVNSIVAPIIESTMNFGLHVTDNFICSEVVNVADQGVVGPSTNWELAFDETQFVQQIVIHGIDNSLQNISLIIENQTGSIVYDVVLNSDDELLPFPDDELLPFPDDELLPISDVITIDLPRTFQVRKVILASDDGSVSLGEIEVNGCLVPFGSHPDLPITVVNIDSGPVKLFIFNAAFDTSDVSGALDGDFFFFPVSVKAGFGFGGFSLGSGVIQEQSSTGQWLTLTSSQIKNKPAGTYQYRFQESYPSILMTTICDNALNGELACEGGYTNQQLFVETGLPLTVIVSSPSIPTVLSVLSTADGIQVSWSEAQNNPSEGYELQERYASDNEFTTVYTGFELTALRPIASEMVFYRVRSCRGGSCSNWSNEASNDLDGDDVTNTLDQCPSTPVGEAVNEVGCAASQLDSDNDGINDAADLCENTLSTETAGSNGCSSAQLDSDNDGVSDNVDDCNNTPYGTLITSVGCSVIGPDGFYTASNLPKTGIESSYASNDDGSLRRGIQRRYIRNDSSHVVTDLNSGLIWLDTPMVRTFNTGLNTANAYCAGLNHAGINNWRLPTLIESVLLLDYKNAQSVGTALLDPVFVNFYTGSESASSHWTSELIGSAQQEQVFLVRSANGDIHRLPTSFTSGRGYVRCVSGEQSQETDFVRTRFMSNAVADMKNRILWQDTSGRLSSNLSLNDAIDYCADLSLDGSNDWRLPNTFELFTYNQSIVRDVSEPKFNRFPSNLSSFLWSSSAADINSNGAAVYNLYRGRPESLDNGGGVINSGLFNARCIREFAAPVLKAPDDITVKIGEFVELSISDSYDPDGSITRFNWYDRNPDVSATTISVNATYTPDTSVAGITEVYAGVVDNNGVFVFEPVTISVIESCDSIPIDERINVRGCEPDEDSDQVNDLLDLCLSTPAGETVDTNGCAASQLDSDNDGVSDAIDICPDTAAGQAVSHNGCDLDLDDLDSDGVDNSLDQCPDTPANESIDANGCGNSQLDSDNDGVNDNLDQCHSTENGLVIDGIGCSVDQLPDGDQDGILNANDLCPGTDLDQGVTVDGCALNQVDFDQDSVNDELDACPNTEANAIVDELGCAAIQKLDQSDLVITSPLASDSVSAGVVFITGEVTSPESVGVTVEGTIANVSTRVVNQPFSSNNGVKHAFSVPVEVKPGANFINVVVTNIFGMKIERSVDFNVGEAPSIDVRLVDGHEGFAPFQAVIQTSRNSTANLLSLDIDINDDGFLDFSDSGTVDEPLDINRSIAFDISRLGIVPIRVVTIDTEGVVSEKLLNVMVLDKTQFVQVLTQRWDSMNDFMVAGDLKSALSQFSNEAIPNQRPVLQAIQDQFPIIVQSFQGMSCDDATLEVVSCAIVRLSLDGDRRLFFITFERDETGILKIREM